MKYFISFLVLAYGIVAYSALKTDYTQRDVRDPRKLETHLEALSTDIAAQSDTNATTTVTQYTPEYVGDTLVGKTGGTNTVWIAVGATTNDWIQVGGP